MSEQHWFSVLLVLLIVLAQIPDALLGHRRRMKALEVLKTYAEKGVEPPARIASALLAEVTESQEVATEGSPQGTAETPTKVVTPKTPRAALIDRFANYLFLACMLGGGAWWCFEASGPRYVLYSTVAFGVFFGIGALGFLIAALFTRDK